MLFRPLTFHCTRFSVSIFTSLIILAWESPLGSAPQTVGCPARTRPHHHLGGGRVAGRGRRRTVHGDGVPVCCWWDEGRDMVGRGMGRGEGSGAGSGSGRGTGLGLGEGALQGTGAPGARLPLVREVVRDALDVHVRHIAKTIDWFPRGPFFRRFAGPWFIGRTGHCSLGTRGRSVPLGVCLRRDSSCDFVTGLRLRCFRRLKAELGGLSVYAGGHCSRCVYDHRSTGLLKGSPVLSLVS